MEQGEDLARRYELVMRRAVLDRRAHGLAVALEAMADWHPLPSTVADVLRLQRELHAQQQDLAAAIAAHEAQWGRVEE